MKQNQNLVLSVIILFIMFVSFSCSKSGNTPANNGTGGTGVTPGTVSIANMAFGPSSLTVKVGTTVTWKNNDGYAHTVTSDDGTSFNSGNIGGGASYSYVTKTAGTFAYHCNIHSGMTATLVVTQ
ncbi:cupredoxin domain-containing protein [Ginsengibacter hankyongi]|nr:plastocyanin/azurin family copper-binding protein [Ginsengibacter hankyongi]